MSERAFQPSEVRSCDVVVLGAGPAGLFAAIQCALKLEPSPSHVVVIEHQQQPGKKLLATGGGACNLTNAAPIKEYPRYFGQAGKTIAPILSRYSNAKLMEYFRGRGVEVEADPSGKVFPRSRKATEIRDALVDHCVELGVELLLDTKPVSLIPSESSTWGVGLDDGRLILGSALIVATGGITYPATGSDGSIWALLRTGTKGAVSRPPMHSALNPLIVDDYDCAGIEGVSFGNVELFITPMGGKRKRFGVGDLLCTDRSFSGPLALNASTVVASQDRLTFNFLPEHSVESLFEELWSLFHTTKKATAKALCGHLSRPTRFIELSVIQAELDSVPAQVSKKSLRTFCELMCARSYQLSDVTFQQNGMITAGGISLDKLDKGTLEARDVPGMYFAGEIIDVHGYTGGFNMQWAFSSAYAAGTSAAASVMKQKAE